MVSDPRTPDLKEEMSEHFAEYESDYRTDDWANVVYEDDTFIVVEDLKGYEFSEWSDEFDGFSEMMHDLARQLVDRRWSSSYPVVFQKQEGN
ncbi:hypothetical protein [Natrialba sp. SSL1]|uniref:hypothetical protein n=1 Tax=Natrialba sp. SSL1 TaxID=1869245 RepID=UPI0008F9175C|nr:hypothetical protein [Natrialba sp. SSL1]OIB58183.1 hypothetical protein BBD46_09910 [Natrialba sp. SSL1]